MQFSYKSWQRIILSIVGICSVSLSFAQTAQAQKLRNLCGKEEVTYIAAETKHFFVSICGSNYEANTYIGLNKNTGKSIQLPLSIDGSKNGGNFFEATNGYYAYQLTVFDIKQNPTQNLTVRKNNRVILREPILRILNGYDPGA